METKQKKENAKMKEEVGDYSQYRGSHSKRNKIWESK